MTVDELRSELAGMPGEFCTPFAGGGGSKRTWRALINLARAMALDNQDQLGRAGDFDGAAILDRFPDDLK